MALEAYADHAALALLNDPKIDHNLAEEVLFVFILVKLHFILPLSMTVFLSLRNYLPCSH